MRTLPELLIPLLLIGMIACGKSDETDLHHQAAFSVRYLSLDRSIRAQAAFWEASDSLEPRTLQIPGEVRFQDRKMTFRSEDLTDPGYLLEYRADFPESLSFETRFEDYPDVHLSFDMEPVSDFSVSSRLSKADGLVLQVSGGRLSREESLVVLLSDDQNTVHTFNLRGPSTDDTHRLTADQLKPLAPGRYTLFLVKKQEQEVRKGGLQVSALIEYFSTSREIDLEE
jgi:hypothetical protein